MLKFSKNPISLALMESQWTEAQRLVDEKPKLASKSYVMQGFFEGMKDATLYPLHQAAATAGVPVRLVESLIEAYPSALYKKESSYDRLPIHCACRKGANPAVIETILKAADAYNMNYNEQSHMCLETDSLRRLPIHYALSNGASPAVITILLAFSPDSTMAVDQRGWTPIHVAASVSCSPEVLGMLLEHNPGAARMRTMQGSLPRHVLNKDHANYEKLAKLLRDAKEEERSSKRALKATPPPPPMPTGMEHRRSTSMPVVDAGFTPDRKTRSASVDDVRPLLIYNSVFT